MDQKKFELYIKTEVLRLEGRLQDIQSSFITHDKHESFLKGSIDALNKIHFYMNAQPKNIRD